MSLQVRAPLSEGAKNQLRQEIVSGFLPAGRRVSIGDAAERLQMSPTPVREALAQLVSEGFLSLEPNRGFYVRPLTVQEVRDLYPIGSALEDLGMRSVPFPCPERVAELRALNVGIDTSLGTDPEATILANQAWHRLLLSDCGNEELRDMIARLRARTFRYEFVCYSFDRTELHTQAQMHDEIVEFLAAGKRRRARTCLRQHWAGNLELVAAAAQRQFE